MTLEPVAVLADRLQANGDPRGELLALELAAALAPTTDESRLLCTSAQELRAANPKLAWPPELWGTRGVLRGGLLVAGTIARRSPSLPAGVAPHCRELVIANNSKRFGVGELLDAYTDMGLRLDGLWSRQS